jgi:hypothetical protein
MHGDSPPRRLLPRGPSIGRTSIPPVGHRRRRSAIDASLYSKDEWQRPFVVFTLARMPRRCVQWRCSYVLDPWVHQWRTDTQSEQPVWPRAASVTRQALLFLAAIRAALSCSKPNSPLSFLAGTMQESRSWIWVSFLSRRDER